jgi:hypothetical protein
MEGTPGVRQTRFVIVRGTKKEAQIEAAKIIAATSKGEYVDSSKETVAEFVTRWLGTGPLATPQTRPIPGTRSCCGCIWFRKSE